jgi:hypothetical protein
LQIKVVGKEDYIISLKETDSLPQSSPLKFTLVELVSVELETGKFSNIQTEKLKQEDIERAAISRMNKSKVLNMEVNGDYDTPLHNENDPSSQIGKHKIMTTSEKEEWAILFIQDRTRVNLQLLIFVIDVLQV